MTDSKIIKIIFLVVLTGQLIYYTIKLGPWAIPVPLWLILSIAKDLKEK